MKAPLFLAALLVDLLGVVLLARAIVLGGSPLIGILLVALGTACMAFALVTGAKRRS